jgi:peptidoglycan hydrolase-like protein with peptidoglycan-binding domain
MGLSINMNIMRKRNLVLSLILAIFLLAPVTHAQAVSSGLTFGTKGSQVATLQQKLQDAGFYEYPNITGFFGAATKQAVIYFQNAYADIILTPLHLTEGTGYVGSLTATVLDGLTANPGTSNTGAPELSLRLSHTTIYVGYGSTIFWHSTNATACVGSNGWSGTFNPSTTKAVFPITSTYYTLTCGNGMASTTKSILVTVSGTPVPEPPVTSVPPVTPPPPVPPVTPPVGTTTPPTATTTPPVTPPVPPLPSTTGSYYVDFASGADTNSGTQASPWKHSPGDPSASDNPKSVILKAGDAVYFKGGVRYYGQIKLNGSGAAGTPIRLIGDEWGVGKAIIDGSEPITGWSHCSSAGDCGGNPNWANIYKAMNIAVPSFLVREPELRLNLTQGEQVIIDAQAPFSTTRYYQTNDNYLSVPTGSVTSTSLRDSRLEGLGGSSLVGAYAYIWSRPNDIAFRKITGYNASTQTISFGPIAPYTKFDTKYAIANANTAGVFNAPGEYYFNLATKTLYVWPLDGVNPNGLVNISARSYGIDLYNASHVVVKGFIVEKQTGDFVRSGAGIKKDQFSTTQDIVITGNEVTLTQTNGYGAIALSHIDTLEVSDNYVHDILGNMRGIQIGGGTNALVKNNRLRNIARTCIYFGDQHNSRISGNTVTDSNSTHGNGITVYQGSDNITVDGNTVIDANIAFTMEASTNLNIYNNVFDGAGHTNKVFADWGASTALSGINRIINNTIVGTTASGIFLASKAAFIVENNILDGGDVHLPGATVRNNLYTRLIFNQKARYGWSLAPGEIVANGADSVLVNPGARDYHLKAGSPAIDAGISIPSVTVDVDGRSRPQGKGTDIGAYEF